jgi:hypothetical protein
LKFAGIAEKISFTAAAVSAIVTFLLSTIEGLGRAPSESRFRQIHAFRLPFPATTHPANQGDFYSRSAFLSIDRRNLICRPAAALPFNQWRRITSG